MSEFTRALGMLTLTKSLLRPIDISKNGNDLCLVWSSPNTNRTLRYRHFTSDIQSHCMESIAYEVRDTQTALVQLMARFYIAYVHELERLSVRNQMVHRFNYDKM